MGPFTCFTMKSAAAPYRTAAKHERTLYRFSLPVVGSNPAYGRNLAKPFKNWSGGQVFVMRECSLNVYTHAWPEHRIAELVSGVTVVTAPVPPYDSCSPGLHGTTALKSTRTSHGKNPWDDRIK